MGFVAWCNRSATHQRLNASHSIRVVGGASLALRQLGCETACARFNPSCSASTPSEYYLQLAEAKPLF